MANANELEHTTGANTAGKHLGLALVVISAAQLMIVLDATIVNVALPTIHADLHFSVSNLEWLITAYALTFGGLLLFGGRTGDLYGKRRMFMVGVGLFAVSSFFGGLAQSDVWLIITRGSQGIGGAIAAPTALSLIATNFPEGRARNRAMGVYAAMSGAGGAVGLLLGGLFTDLVSWRWIFFVNVPIAAIVLLLAPRALNESATTSGRLDVPGALTATAGMISLVYGLSKASTHGWGAAGTSVPLVVGAVLLVIFVLIEAKARAPLMPLGIFSDRNRWGSYLLMFCIAAGLFAMFFFLTQFLQNVLGWSPLRTGVGFLPMSAGIVAAAGLASRLVGQVGVRLPLLIGPSLAIVGFLLLSRLSVTSSYADVIGPLLLIAVGMGLSFVPLTLSAVSGVAHDEAGLASALLNTSQQIGGALGLAVLATVAIDATRSSLANAAALAHGHIGAVAQGIATTHGYTTAFEVAAGVDFLGLLVALFVLKKPAEGATETAANEDEAGVEREPRAYSLRVGANDPVPES